MKHLLRKRVRIPILFMMVLALPFTVSAQYSGSGQGTQNDPYLIFNPAQLNQVRNFLNQSGVYFKLMNDLDMTSWINTNSPSTGWSSIGSSSSPFKGVFLGEGHTIKGLKISSTSSYRGLFGYLNEATVSNLNLEIDFVIGSADYVGGLTAYSLSSTISEISVKGKIEGGSKYIGGVIGYSVDSKITDVCSMNMAIAHKSGQSTTYVGGCIGYAQTENGRYSQSTTTSPLIGLRAENVNITAGSYVGGVIGYADFTPTSSSNSSSITISNQISDCFANGEIKSTDNTGGLIGLVKTLGYYYYYSNFYYYVAATLSINNCGANVNLFSSKAGDYIGGIIGRVITGYEGDKRNTNSNYGAVDISNCFALGDVKGSSNVGGLIGSTEQYELTNTYCKVSVLDSYYHGDVTGSGDNIGGIVGDAYYTTVRRCYSDGNINGVNKVGGIIGCGSNCTVTSSASLNKNINAAVSGAGRIFGFTSSCTIGESGTSSSNKGYVFVNLTENGKILTPSSNSGKNGDDQGEATLKLRATYQGIGWNFTNDWTILETESYPYKVTQTAPPTISSVPETGSLVLRGKCLNGGEVFATINGETFSAECDNSNNWVVRLESALKSGETINVYAVAPGKYPSYSVSANASYLGSGTEEDPYQIYTAHDLAYINGDAYYILMNDIDLSNYGDWTPIGRNGGAMCHLDGYNYTVSGMTVNSESSDYNGLFATLRNGSVKNLVIKDASVSGGNYTGILAGSIINSEISGCQTEGTVSGGNYTGGLCGYVSNSTISSVRILADINGVNDYAGGIAGYAEATSARETVYDGTATGSKYNGGIFGYMKGSTVNVAFTSGMVTAKGETSYSGGIAGQIDGSSAVSESYSTALVKSGLYAGGICGLNYGKIENCYSSGNLESTRYAGGIAGYNVGTKASVKGCVAANEKIELSAESPIGMRVLGGIRDNAEIPGFYDNLALEQMIISLNGIQQDIYDDPLNGVSKTELLLKSKGVYEELGWDFEKIWSIDGNGHFPFLTVLGAEEGGSILPANCLDIRPVITEAGVQFVMLVNMTNKDELAGAQFDIVLPEGITIATDVRNRPQITLGSRLNSMQHSIGSRLAPDGAMRVLITPRTGGQIYNFPGNVGDIAQIVFDVNPSLVNGEYDIELKNVMFGTPDGVTTVFANNCKGHVSIKNDKVTVGDVEGMPGKKSEIELNLINKSQIVGYQYDILLPQGVKVALNEVGKPAIAHGDRTTTAVHGIACKEIAPNTLRVLSYPSDRQTISGNEGVMSKITLEISEDMPQGVYPVHIRNIFLSNTDLNSISVEDQQAMLTVKKYVRNGDVNEDGLINVSDVIGVAAISSGSTGLSLNTEVADLNGDGSVNVQDVTLETNLVYNELYPAMARSMSKSMNTRAFAPELPYGNLDVYFEPFVIQPGETRTVKLYLNNPENDIFAIQGRIFLPEGLSLVQDQYGLWGQPCDRSEQDMICMVTDMGDRWGFSFSNGLSLYEFWGNNGPVVEFNVHADELMTAGVYQIDFNDIQLSDPVANGFRALDAPFTVVVGTPEDLESLEINGRLSDTSVAEFNTLMNNYETLTELDLRDVRENKGTAEIKSSNPNMLILTAENLEIANRVNVVADGICENLVLTDGYDFNSSETFTSVKASYSRNMNADEWDTLCLPYDAMIPADVYVGSLVEPLGNTVSFSVTEGIQNAHTPVLIHSVNGGQKLFEGENVEVTPVSSDANNRIVGSYRTVFGLKNAVHPTGGRENLSFAKAEKILPFHAYVQLADGEHITTGILTVNIGSLTGDEQIYTLQGVLVKGDISQIESGIYIVNGKKTYLTRK